jgi:hypothetical protein
MLRRRDGWCNGRGQQRVLGAHRGDKIVTPS